jgi:hypothetical protein
MITIWKVKIKEWERDNFMTKYNLFSWAEWFLGCQFYKTGNNDLIAVESWISQEAHKSFAQSLAEWVMWELFSLLEGQPEMYECELGKLIK